MNSARFIRVATVTGALGATSLYFFYPSPSKAAPTSTERPLAPTHFTPSTVISTEVCDAQTRLITLAVPPKLAPNAAQLQPIWSVFIKDDDIQVERPYTPLEGIDEHGHMKFWIKRYPGGEVGRWLHTKRAGDQVELRGPLQTWLWQEGDWDDVIMISGGTGITPFYQLFHSYISRNATPKTRFTLLHSSKSPAELPPKSILQPLLDHRDNFRVRLFVDSIPLDENAPVDAKLQVGRIDRRAVEDSIGYGRSWWFKSPLPQRRILFLVCGPEPMITAIAGPYGRNYSQGPVAGILGELGFTAAQVRKL
ncbi:ferredoxin reductase-like protein [Hymenopellis radicata]|nr:ferredoxin reductase-like protein [Hymenopellis radicata]